jgi:predicted enzyme related to lactoylglutathione lyase
MTTIDRHAPGSFCWFELTTTDQEAAKTFYQSLFEWTSEDSPMGPGEMYTTFQVPAGVVSAAFTMRKEQQAMGIPPHWLIYVAVDSADVAAARASSLGATLIMAPFDVMDLGRMAVVQDPTGSVIAIWEGKKNIGTTAVQEPGCVVWADCSTPDQEKAANFYRDWLGWKMVGGKNEVAVKAGEYFHIVNGEDFIGGIPPSTNRDPRMPAHWLMYVAVPDTAAVIEKAKSLGARLLHGPMTIEGARTFAVLGDPQGAVFAVVDERG